ESRFEIEQDDTLVLRQSPAANVTTATFTGLNVATSYHWYVRACNAAGCSAWLGPVNRTPDGGSVPPTAPTTLAASSPVVGRVDLTWTDTSSNETRFEIAQDDTLVVRQSPAANVTAATFTGLNAATSYHFYVRACNAAGCSAWLGPVNQTPDGSSVPATRTNVALAA